MSGNAEFSHKNGVPVGLPYTALIMWRYDPFILNFFRTFNIKG